MPYIYKIATININGISSDNRILLLSDFLFKHDIDIALLQEVTTTKLTCIRNYAVLDNIGTEGRGTAILSNPGISLISSAFPPDEALLPVYMEQRLSIYMRHLVLKEKRTENASLHKRFCHSYHPIARKQIVAGDFNCILNNSECTGNGCFSRSLAILVREMDLYDAWGYIPGNNGYTHYAPKSVSRIDRIYLSQMLLQRKTGIETRVVACTDHLAAVLRI